MEGFEDEMLMRIFGPERGSNSMIQAIRSFIICTVRVILR
jgi:hypothetical protein